MRMKSSNFAPLFRAGVVAFAFAVVFTALPSLAVEPYTAPSAEINGDGKVDAVDIQCEVLLFTMIVYDEPCGTAADCEAIYGSEPPLSCGPAFGGADICLPACIGAGVSIGESASVVCDNPDADDADCLGLVQKRNADLNCDGDITNVDFLFLVQVLVSKLGGANTADYDSDGKLNFCDDDSDGDGDPDTTDCEDLDELVNSLNPELCDGEDNDCDSLVDADDPSLAAEDCESQQGVCAGSTKPAEFCSGGSWSACGDAEYLAHSGMWEAAETLCDGLDNDCDGLIDADDPDIAAPPCEIQEGVCLGAQKTSAQCEAGGWAACDAAAYLAHNAAYEATETLCDSLDNDCNAQIDEPYPTLGAVCDGTDGDLCENGTLTCAANGVGTACTNEFPEAIVETCNNSVDDDCDGSVDENTPESPCEAYKPPMIGARVDFDATVGYPVEVIDKGLGYYDSDVWDLTDITKSTTVDADCHGVASGNSTVPITPSAAAAIDFYTGRDTLYSDDKVLRLVAFVTDSVGRPVSGLANVQVDVSGPFGASQVGLSSFGSGMYTGSYSPDAASFNTGGTEDLVASTGAISSTQRSVVLTPLPTPATLTLPVGVVGATLPLGPRLAGANFTVPIRVNTGTATLASFQFEVTYPTALVDYVTFQVSNGGLNPASVNHDAGAGTVNMATTRDVGTDAGLLTGDVLLGTMTFQIESGAAQGASGAFSGEVLELSDGSGNPIFSQVAFDILSGTGQAQSGLASAYVVADRGMIGWIDDLSLADVNEVFGSGDTGVAHVYIFRNNSANPGVAGSFGCVCGTPAVCSCTGGVVSVTGGGQSEVTLSAAGSERVLTVDTYDYNQVVFTLADPSLEAIAGWAGHYQASWYTVVAQLDGPTGTVELDVTRDVTLSSDSPAIASWDQPHFQIQGEAPGSANISVLGDGAQTLATDSITVTSSTVAPDSLTLIIPSLVQMTKAAPSPVLASVGEILARVRISSLFTVDGQQSVYAVYLTCADGASSEVTGDADLVLTPQGAGTVVTVADGLVTAVGTGSDTIDVEINPGGGAIAAGQGIVEVSLPDAESADFTPSSTKIAISATDSAATVKGLSTTVDLSVTVYYGNGTDTDMTDDSRTYYEITDGETLGYVCNVDDAMPGCAPGRVISLEAGIGEVTVKASWPGLYSAEVAAYAVVEVVSHQSMTLTTWEDFSPPGVQETVLSLVEATSNYQKARLKLVETFSDGSTSDITSHGGTTYLLKDGAGQPEAGVVSLSGTKLLAVAPGTVFVEGVNNGNTSNQVEMMVEGGGIDDGDGKEHADVTELYLFNPGGLVGVKASATKTTKVQATYDDGTHEVIINAGSVIVPDLAEFLLGNAQFTNPADSLYATINATTGVATLQGNGLVRVIAQLAAGADAAPAYAPGASPEITQANPLVIPSAHPGTRWIKCNLNPTTGDADLGDSTGLAVPLVVDPGETFDVNIRLNSGTDPLGAFTVEVYFDDTVFEVPLPSEDYLSIEIASDAGAINDPSPGTVKVTVVPTSGSNLTGTTHVATMTLRALNTKSGGPIYTQLSGQILEMYRNCPDATCPSIEGAWGPAPRGIDAGLVSIDPEGNLAEEGDFNDDGKFGAGDLQAIVNYVVDPGSAEFVGLSTTAANIFPDKTEADADKVQAFDAFYGAMISVGLSHFVEGDYDVGANAVTLRATVKDGSSTPTAVTENLDVTFELGLMSGASMADHLGCGAGCAASSDADSNPVPERHLYAATHVGSGVYEATVGSWSDLPGSDQVGVVVILQNKFANGSDKGDPKVYLKTPFENVASPFDPLFRIDTCDDSAECEAGYHCADGTCEEDKLAGEACTADLECADGLHCNEVAGICEADQPEGGSCVEDSDCEDGTHCDESSGLCVADLGAGEPCDADSDCAGDSCVAGVCCDAALDCCLLPADCPAEYSAAATCDTPLACQGSRLEATCVGGNCGTAAADDDSACDVTVPTGMSCEPYADAPCTGDPVQGPPVCASSCVDDTGCSDNGKCVGAVCGHVLCTPTGNQGETAGCEFHLAREDQAFTSAVMLEFFVSYEDSELTPVSMEACGELAAPFNLPCTVVGGECNAFGDPTVYCDTETLTCSQCNTYLVDDDSAQLATGHTIVTCAVPPANCLEDSFHMLFWGTESLPITGAYLDGGIAQGTSLFLELAFTLDVDLPSGSKVAINPDGFIATNPQAELLETQLQHFTGGGNPDHFISTGPVQ